MSRVNVKGLPELGRPLAGSIRTWDPKHDQSEHPSHAN